MTEQEVFMYSMKLMAIEEKLDSKAAWDVTGEIVQKYFDDLRKIAVSNITEPLFIFALKEFLQAVESNADEDSLVLADKIQKNSSTETTVIIK